MELNIKALEKRSIDVLIECAQLLKESSQIISFEEFSDKVDLVLHEVEKIEKQELSLAVIATMKAGKSTFLNAVIGKKFLPHNDRPMTVIPTEVALRSDTDIIKLLLSSSFISYLKDIVQSLKKSQNRNDIKKLLKGTGYSNLIPILDNVFDGVYDEFSSIESENPLIVLQTLTIINHLIRISIVVFGGIDDLPDVPRIIAPFVPFPNIPLSEKVGSLILVDTPGEDEALLTREQVEQLVSTTGNLSVLDVNEKVDKMRDSLRKILNNQLSKASVCVALVNYTNQNNKANIDVISKLAMNMGQRGPEQIFILLNKYDQKQDAEDSSGIEEFKSDYAERFRGTGFKPSKQVFPISALYAAESRNFNTELGVHGPEKVLKTRSYSQLVHAYFNNNKRLVKTELANPSIQRAQTFADDLWNDSYFSEFLGEVISKLIDNSLPIVLRSALEVTGKIVNNLRFQAEITSNSLSDEAHSLTTKIKDLEGDLMRLKAQRQKIEKVNKKVDFLRSTLHTDVENVFFNRDSVPDDILKPFGSSKEIEAHESGVRSFFSKQFNEYRDVKSIARTIAASAEKRLGQIAKKLSKDFRSKFNLVSEEVFDIIQDETQSIIDELQRKLKDEFNLTSYLSPPTIDVTSEDFKTSVKFTVRERKVDYYLYESEHSILKKKDVISEYRSSMKSLERQFHSEVDSAISELLDSVNSYFEEIDYYIDAYKSSFEKAVKNNELSLEGKKNLGRELVKLIPKLDDVEKRVTKMSKELKSIY